MTIAPSQNSLSPQPIAVGNQETGQPRRQFDALWIATALACSLMLYIASFGPACWLLMWLDQGGGDWLCTAYAPILWTCKYGPRPIHDGFEFYLNFGLTNQGLIIEDATVWFRLTPPKHWIFQLLGL